MVLGFLTKQWVGGVFLQNWWSLAGDHSTPVVNQMNLQYFLFRMLPNAWQVGFAPNILVDWRADGSNQVTFPLGLGVGKTFRIDGVPPSKRASNSNGWPGIPMISASASISVLSSSRWCRP